MSNEVTKGVIVTGVGMSKTLAATDRQQVCLNEAATQMFRDTADQEYIAARLAYRARLVQPFLWSAMHSLEKYLKAILLFNGESTRNISHNLCKGLRAVREISDIEFDFDTEVVNFMEYLSAFGNNRYLTHGQYVRTDALELLDRSVWNIRRYCFFMRYVPSDGVNLLPFHLANINAPKWRDRPHTYRLRGGYLEKVIEKRSEGYHALVWMNPYYGRQRKRRRVYRQFSLSLSTVHENLPDCFEHIKGFIRFSKRELEYYGSP